MQRVLFDLLGPIIDPIGYQLELETYVTKIMRGRANSYMSAVGFLASAALFFHFVVEPQEALMVKFTERVFHFSRKMPRDASCQ